MQLLTESPKTRRKSAKTPNNSGNCLAGSQRYTRRHALAGNARADFDACFSYTPSVFSDLAAPSKWAVRLSIPQAGKPAQIAQEPVTATSEATAIALALKKRRPAPGFRVLAVFRTL